MKKTTIKILQTIIVPYALLVLLLYLSFGIAEAIVDGVVGRIWRFERNFELVKIVKSVALLVSVLILGIGAIKFVDKYNQEK